VGIYGPGMSINDRDLVIKAVEAGAEVVRSHYGSALTRFPKSAGDFATTADVEAEKAIVDVLRTARPDDLVLGEESGHTGNGESARLWLVDPLCGTLNFGRNAHLDAPVRWLIAFLAGAPYGVS
jgi:myo-inositol-1(or 4)-monophosphatase